MEQDEVAQGILLASRLGALRPFDLGKTTASRAGHPLPVQLFGPLQKLQNLEASGLLTKLTFGIAKMTWNKMQALFLQKAPGTVLVVHLQLRPHPQKIPRAAVRLLRSPSWNQLHLDLLQWTRTLFQTAYFRKCFQNQHVVAVALAAAPAAGAVAAAAAALCSAADVANALRKVGPAVEAALPDAQLLSQLAAPRHSTYPAQKEHKPVTVKLEEIQSSALAGHAGSWLCHSSLNQSVELAMLSDQACEPSMTGRVSDVPNLEQKASPACP